MVFNLVINSNNAINNTTFNYKFKKGSFEIEGDEEHEDKQAQMCISSATIPFSWYNVNAGLYGNNVISYIWGGTTKSITAYGYVLNNILTIVEYSGTAFAVNDAIYGTGIPANTYITAVVSSYSNQGIYTLNNYATSNQSPSTYQGYLASATKIYINATPTLTFSLNNSVFSQIGSTEITTAPVSSLYTPDIANWSYTPITFSGYTQSSGTSIVLSGITSTTYDGYYIAGTGVPIGNTSSYSSNNLVNYSGTATESTAGYTLTNVIVYQDYNIFYQTLTGTYASSAFIDSYNNSTFPNGQISTSNSTLYKNIVTTNPLPNTSVAFTIKGYIPSTTTIQFVSNNTVATNQYVFSSNTGFTQPYITALSANKLATLAGAAGTVTPSTGITGFAIQTTNFITSNAGLTVNTFITGALISGTYTNITSGGGTSGQYVLSASTALVSTAVGTYANTSIYTSNIITYVTVPTGTPAVGNYIYCLGAGSVLGATITAIDTVNQYITISGTFPFTPTPTYTYSGYISSTSTIVSSSTSGLTTNMGVSANVASASKNWISSISGFTITMPTASLTFTAGTTITGYIKNTTTLVSNATVSGTFYITGTGLTPPTQISGSSPSYTLTAFSTAPTATSTNGISFTFASYKNTTQFTYIATAGGTPTVGMFLANNNANDGVYISVINTGTLTVTVSGGTLSSWATPQSINLISPVTFTYFTPINIGYTSPSTTTTYTPVSLSSFAPTTFSIYNPQYASLKAYTPVTYNLYPSLSFTSYQTSTINPFGTLNTLSLTDGNYTISQLNTALQNYMISQNQYLTQTSTSSKVFYINLGTSSTSYAYQFTLTPIPSSLPSGYTAPTGFPYSSNGYTSIIYIIPTTNYGFGQLIGFNSGYYPSTLQTTTQIVSGTAVATNPVTSLIIRCNLISNDISNQTDILDVIPIANSIFDTDIIYLPSFEKWITLKNGVYSDFFIYIQDQNFNTIQALDPNSTFSLLIKNGKKLLKRKIMQENPTKIQSLFSNEDI